MGHETCIIRFHGQWNCHGSWKLSRPNLMGHENMFSWPWKGHECELKENLMQSILSAKSSGL